MKKVQYLLLCVIAQVSFVQLSKAANSSQPISESYPLTDASEFSNDFKYISAKQVGRKIIFTTFASYPETQGRYFNVTNNALSISTSGNENDTDGVYYLDNQIPLDTSFTITADAHLDNTLIESGHDTYIAVFFGIACVAKNKNGTIDFFKTYNNRFYSCLSRTGTESGIMNRAVFATYTPNEKEIYSPGDVGSDVALKLEYNPKTRKVSSSYKLPGASDFIPLGYKILPPSIAGSGKSALILVDQGLYYLYPGFSVSLGQMTLKNLQVSYPNSGITITRQPVSVTVKAKKPVTLTVTASGEALNYQWYKDGSPIRGATKASFSIKKAVLKDVGSYYVVIKNSVDDVGVTSDNASVSLQ
jgi:hypothetical protein